MSKSADFERPALYGGSPVRTAPFPSGQRYGEEELELLREALAQNTLFYAQGKFVHQLEAEVARLLEMPYAIATSSGTASLHAALMALGISPGDEVVTAPITDMGTLTPILWQGAVPRFADVDHRTYCMTPASVEAVLTQHTRVVIAVHLWGNACDLTSLRKLCDERGIALVEDCAQAWGCEWEGAPVGTQGVIGCFSLNEFKHISCGDGGVVVTSDEALARKLRLATDKAYNREPGAAMRNPTFLAGNYRMTELQAAVALAQLGKLADIVEKRRVWCEGLTRRLEGLEGVLPPLPTPGCNPSWWFYMLRIEPEILRVDTDEFAAGLVAEGIPASAHYIGQCVYTYPVFTEHSAFERGGHPYQAVDYTKTRCPGAEQVLATGVMLPAKEYFGQAELDDTARALERLAHWHSSRP